VPRPRPIAVLFDLDGTLVDTVPFILSAVRHAFEGYGACPTDVQWKAGIGTPLRVQLASFARSPEDVEPLFARYRAYWLAEHDRQTRCFPGALELLLALAGAGHPIAVVTAKLAAGAERTLRHTGLAPLVGAVVAADTTARPKPWPDPVVHALAVLGRRADEAVLVGDSPHDVTAGKAAGVESAAALWGACDRESFDAARPDHWLATLDEVAPLVGTIQARDT
jgi:pyrophosphatase PpaX